MQLLARLRNSSHKDLLVNAGSMIGTTVVTAGLGFVYWWLAARHFPQEAVGFASALVSGMGLMATFGVFGLGTLLIGELPRRPEQRGELVGTALAVAALISGLLGLIFAAVVPQLSDEFAPLRSQPLMALLFAAGVVLTATTLVLDQALIGLLRGGRQLWRNSVFAVAKLVALLVAAIWLSGGGGLTIYNTWTLGNLLSLLAVAGTLAAIGMRRPRWALLRQLPGAALSHHGLNLALQLPGLALPVLVTGMLSAEHNASFYMAWLLLHLVFAVPYTLTTVLFAAGATDRAAFRHKLWLTLRLALAAGTLSTLVLWPSADILMGVFGPRYAEQAGWTLRLMSLGVFPLIVKDHFVAIMRVRNQVRMAVLPALAGSLAELGFAALGAWLYGMNGLSIGFVAALCLEALAMGPTVWRAAFASVEREPALAEPGL